MLDVKYEVYMNSVQIGRESLVVPHGDGNMAWMHNGFKRQRTTRTTPFAKVSSFVCKPCTSLMFLSVSLGSSHCAPNWILSRAVRYGYAVASLATSAILLCTRVTIINIYSNAFRVGYVYTPLDPGLEFLQWHLGNYWPSQ